MINSDDDRENAGGEGPGERSDKHRLELSRLEAALIGGVFLLIGGWLTYAVNSNEESMERIATGIASQLTESKEFMATQTQDLKERLDRIENRVVFLEQNRQTSTDADQDANIALAAHEGQSH